MRLSLLVLVLLLVGCSERVSKAPGRALAVARTPAAKGVEATSADDISAPFDVPSVIREVRGRFRPEGDGYVSDQLAYRAHVGERGARVETHEGQAGIALRTAAIRRGATDLVRTRGPLQVAAARTSRAHGPALSEHVETRAMGIEQSWRFAEAPAGHGELEVHVAVEGARYVGADAAGIRLAAASTDGALFRFGHGTWVDALQREWPVPARWTGSGIVLRVPESVLADTRWPAVLDPVVGPEQALRDGGLGPVSGAMEVAIGFDGAQYLVVWSELYRPGKTLVATRVTQTGKVLDPYGIVIDETCCARRPVVSRQSDGFLIAWERHENVQTFVRAIRSDGSLPSPVTPVAASPSAAPRLAFDGTNTLVVYSSWNELYAVRVGPSGAVLDAPPRLVGSASEGDVAFQDGAYFVVWSGDTPNGYTLFGRHVGTDGVPTEAQPIAYGLGLWPQLAHDGSNMLLAFHRQPTPTNTDIYTLRLTAQGQPIANSERALAASAADETLIAARNQGQTVAWLYTAYENTLQTLLLRRMRTGGAFVDAAPLPLGPASRAYYKDAAISAGKEGFLALVPFLGARLVPPTGPLYGLTDFARARRRQSWPSVGYGNGTYLIAWSELRRNEGEYDVLAVRVDKSGALIDCDPIVLGSILGYTRPRIAFDGTRFFVVWSKALTDYSVVVGSFVGTDRSVSDPGGKQLVSVASGDADVAFDGVNYVLAWADSRNGVAYDVYAGRVTTQGAPLDGDGFAVATGGRHQPPRVAALGSTVLITWINNVPLSTNYVQLARRLTGTTFLDTPPITISGTKRAAAVSANAGVFHLFGFDHRSGTGDARLMGAQINASTGAQSSVILDPQTATRDQLEATFDGTRHVLLFEQWDYQHKRQLRAADTDGTSASLYTVVAPTDQLGPAAIASAKDGTSLVAYALYDDARPYVQERIRYRLLGSTTPPAPRNCPAEPCESGFIIDGVCCDSPCGLGRADDCMACSVALGAAQDGVCGYVQAGRACRAASATCPTPPVCSGQNLYCPDDGSDTCNQPVAGVDAGVLLDAGTAPTDAGTPNQADAGGDATTQPGPSDAATRSEAGADPDATLTGDVPGADAQASTRDASGDDESDVDVDDDEDPLDDDEGAATTRSRRAGGCGCSIPDARAGANHAWLAGLLLFSALYVRRRVRAPRAV